MSQPGWALATIESRQAASAAMNRLQTRISRIIEQASGVVRLRNNQVDEQQEGHQRTDAELIPEDAPLLADIRGAQPLEVALGRGYVGSLALPDLIVLSH